ncbi:MAG: ADP-ribosylglycohydrolase family protein [Planctomycetota bacterium]|nr:ADP-ribosylglycohydrolase family protein [Planctomycetota bacterium]
MPTLHDHYTSRFLATLPGCAVADAVSFPYKEYSRTYLRSLARPVTSEYARHPAGQHPPGQYTERTQATLAVATSILEAGGVEAETAAEHLIPLWRDVLVIDADPSSTKAMTRLVEGVTDWRSSGHGEGVATAAPLTRAVPVGLWDATEPERIPQDAARVLRLTHNDSRVLGAGAGLAAAIGYNLRSEELVLGVLLDSISEAAGVFHEELAEAVHELPRILSQTDVRAWEMIDDLLPDDRHPPREDGLGTYVVPVFLLSLYHFLKSPGDYERAVNSSIKLGGEPGSVVSLTGALVASHQGGDGLPEGLLADLINVREIDRLAHDLLHARMRATETATMAEAALREEEDGDAG